METPPTTPTPVLPLGAADPGPSRRFRRLRRVLVALAVVVGTGAAVAAWRQADRSADRSTDSLTQRASDLITSRVDTIRSGLAGAGSLVAANGSVAAKDFEAYATEVVSASTLSALALVPVVPGGEREAFEEELGRGIVDRTADQVTPAPRRAVHYPVQVVVPATASNESLLGFDLAGDLVRREAVQAARDSGELVLSRPVPSQPTGSTSFFVVQALYRPKGDLTTVPGRRAALVGFVSTAYTGEALAEGLMASLPPNTDFAVRDDGVLLAASDGDAPRGQGVAVPVAGRTWSLVVAPVAADNGLAISLAVITVLVAGGLSIVLRRTERHEQEIQATVRLISVTTELAQALAGARTVTEVKGVVRDRVPEVLGVEAAGLAMVDRDTGTIDLPIPDLLSLTVARPDGNVPLDAAVPLAEVVHTGEARFLPVDGTWRGEGPPALVDGSSGSSPGARAYCPLCVDESEVVAVLALTWPRGSGVAPAVRSTVETVAEICQYALTRALTTDQATRRASELAVLAERLAAVGTIEAVGEVVTTFGRAPVEAAATSIGIIEGDVLRIEHGPTVPADYRQRFSRPRLDEPLAFTETARTGETLLFEDQDAYDDRYPTARGPRLGARAVLPLHDTVGTTIGAIAHLWPSPRSFDDALLSTLTTIAELTGQAIERARLVEAQEADARHLEGTARLAQGLAVRTNSEAVMSFLTAGVLAPLDAVDATVAVLEDGRLRRSFSGTGLGQEVARLVPETSELDDPSPLVESVVSGQPVLLASVEDLRTSYPHMEQGWRALGFGAAANLPLRDRQGTVIGALGIAWDHPVVFDTDLRDRLATVVGIAGQTLERAQLVDQIRADAERSEALAELGEVLARARTVDEVTHAVVDRVGRAVGGHRSSLAVADADQLTLWHPPGVPHELVQRLDALANEGRLPHADALAADHPLMFDSVAALADQHPAVAEQWRVVGTAAGVYIGLRDGTGQPLGALGLFWDHPVARSERLAADLRDVSDLVGQALERARLADAEHRLVTTLQESVLAPLPGTPSLSCAGRYLPAARSIGMGGDWFEGIVLDDGRYVIVVGDVAGHGITAVAQMAQFRAVIGALVRLDTPLEAVFPFVTDVVQGLEPIASALIVVVDEDTGRMRYAAAGHLPPLLRHPDGNVEVLGEGRQPLLGVPSAARAVAEHDLPVGGTLLCYTDGLVERRGEPIDLSVLRLAGHLSVLGDLPADLLADDLIAARLGEQAQADDIALAIVQRR